MARENEIRIRVKAEVDKAIKDLKKIEKTGKKANKGLATSTGKAGKAQTSLLGRLKKVKGGIVGIALAVGGFALALGKAIGIAGLFEQVNVAFKTFLGSAGAAKKVLGELSKFAAFTPFTEDEVNQAGKALLAFNVNAEDLVPTLRAIGDISAGTGKNFNELAVIFGKAKIQGTLFAEDINQLTEAGVPVIDEFARIMGVSTGEVKKLGSEGKITFPLLEQAFKDLTGEGGKFFELTKQQSETLLGRFSTLKSNLTLFARSIGNVLLPLLKPVISTVNDFVKATNALIFGNKELIKAEKELVKVNIEIAELNKKRSEQGRFRTRQEEKDFRKLISLRNTLLGQVREQKGDEVGLTKVVKKQAEEKKNTALELARFQGLKREAELLAVEEQAKSLRILARNDAEELALINEAAETKKLEINNKFRDLELAETQKLADEKMKLQQQQENAALAGLTKFASASRSVSNFIADIEEKRIRDSIEDQADADEEVKRLRIGQARANKAITIFGIAIDTAKAVTAALTIPPPAGPILAGINFAAGVAQGIAVEATPIPSLQKGTDFVPQDTLAFLHQGERVLTREENEAVSGGSSSRTIQIENITVTNPNPMDFINKLQRQYGVNILDRIQS